MESLISTHSPSLFSPSRPSLPFPSIPTRPPHLQQRRRPNLLILLSSSNPITPTAFNGWDDDLDQPTAPNPDPLLTFLTPLGINRTHFTIFLLGFLSSLAFFKARFTPIVVVPISVVAFIAGFSAGATQPGSLFGLLGQFGRRDSFDDKAREVGEFLDDLGEKMAHLKDGLEGAIQRNGLDVGSVRSYLDVVEVVSSVADQTKKSIEGSIDREMRKKSSQKPSKKRREGAIDGFDFVQHIGSIFEDYLIGFGPQKSETVNKAETMEQVISGNADGDVRTEFKVKQKPNSNLRSGDAADGVVFDNSAVNGDASRYGRDGRFADDMFSYDDELQSSRTTVHYTTKRQSFEELVFKQIYKRGTLQDDMYESEGHGRRVTESMDFTSSETGASSFSENSLETHEKSYFVSRERKPSMSKSERGIKYEQDMEADDMPSSSNTSADEEFNRNVKEATNLLKLARECLVKRVDEEKADSMLYKSSRLLSTAVALKPMSLLAMGQLGNTYLLHGELKLKVSREIRTLMPRSDGLLHSNGRVHSNGRASRLNKLDTRALSRENITSVLIDVCEECDKLLVEAGRKYRKALAIDADDIRALYNWGLALSFRAQLIADIGPEAAIDADKVYLAAIDKFNAMTSRSNAYAPDALYRWGLALQQRSYLRPDRSRDKMELLQQAKSLYEDVLSVESDNKLVREALSSCLSEIEYSRLW